MAMDIPQLERGGLGKSASRLSRQTSHFNGGAIAVMAVRAHDNDRQLVALD
jgi:hypothetical protein